MLGALVGGLIGGAIGASSGGGRHTVYKTETRTIVEREKIDYKKIAEELVYAFKKDLVAPWQEQLAKKKRELEEQWGACTKCGQKVKIASCEHIEGEWQGCGNYYIVAYCGCDNSRYKVRISDLEWYRACKESQSDYEKYHYQGRTELTWWGLRESHDGPYAFVWKEILKHFKTIEQDENSSLLREIKELEEKIAYPYPYIGMQPLQQEMVSPLLDKGLENIAEPTI